VDVQRMDADRDSHGLYTIALNDDIGYFTAEEVNAILAVVRARKNS
jgi:hypothetical protein